MSESINKLVVTLRLITCVPVDDSTHMAKGIVTHKI